jgi:hypothetical protein
MLAGATLIAKGAGVGIYARIDNADFENDVSGRLVRISGLFEVPSRMSSGMYELPSVGICTSGFLQRIKMGCVTSWTSQKHSQELVR